MSSGRDRSMKIYAKDGDAIVEIYSIKRDGEKLVMDAKVLDAMRMDMIITLDEVFSGLKMLLRGVVPYALLLPYFGLKRLFRRSPK